MGAMSDVMAGIISVGGVVIVVASVGGVVSIVGWCGWRCAISVELE